MTVRVGHERAVVGHRSHEHGWRGGIVIAAALAMLLMGLQPRGAFAFHDDETPIIHSESTDRPVWVSYLFSTDGAKVVFDIEAHEIRLPSQTGAVLYDERGRALWGFIGTSLPGGGDGAYLDFNPAPGMNVHVDLLGPSPEREIDGLGVTINNPALGGAPRVGTFKMVLWHAGEAAERVNYALRGGEGVAYLSSKTGTDTFLHTSKDFSGTATARGRAFVGAWANLQTALHVHAEDTLVGSYFAPFSDFMGVPQAHGEMSVETPAGARTCPCSFIGYAEDDPAVRFGAGDYTFHLTGAGIGFAEIVLGGADVQLPEQADLSIVSLSAIDPPARIAVGTKVDVTLRALLTNRGPWEPMDSVLTTSASGSTGTTVLPQGAEAVATLSVGQERTLEQTFSLGCETPGQHIFTFQGEVSPAHPGDFDPESADNTAETSLTAECVTW